MWDFPDAVLVRDQNVALTPGKAVGLIEVFGVALDELGLAAIFRSPQERQMAGRLLW